MFRELVVVVIVSVLGWIWFFGSGNQKSPETAVYKLTSEEKVMAMIEEGTSRLDPRHPPEIRIVVGASQEWLATTDRFISAEDEEEMAKKEAIVERDAKVKEWDEARRKKGVEEMSVYVKNTQRVFETSIGAFTLIECRGRYSVNSQAHGLRDAKPHEVLVVPSGRKYRASRPNSSLVEVVVEIEGRIFFLTHSSVREWSPDVHRPDDDRVIVQIEINGAADMTRISGVVAGRYLIVNRADRVGFFGGLLVPDDESGWRWLECPVRGFSVFESSEVGGKIQLSKDGLFFDPQAEAFECGSVLEKVVLK